MVLRRQRKDDRMRGGATTKVPSTNDKSVPCRVGSTGGIACRRPTFGPVPFSTKTIITTETPFFVCVLGQMELTKVAENGHGFVQWRCWLHDMLFPLYLFFIIFLFFSLLAFFRLGGVYSSGGGFVSQIGPLHVSVRWMALIGLVGSVGGRASQRPGNTRQAGTDDDALLGSIVVAAGAVVSTEPQARKSGPPGGKKPILFFFSFSRFSAKRVFDICRGVPAIPKRYPCTVPGTETTVRIDDGVLVGAVLGLHYAVYVHPKYNMLPRIRLLLY